MAIHRDVDPGSKLSFLEWYPQTILPELAKLPNEEVSYQHLLRSLEYWDDIAIAKAETAILLKLGLDFGIAATPCAGDASEAVPAYAGMTSRRALRQVKSVRIVKKTLSGISKSLWQVNQIPEEIQRIFDAVGLELQQLLRNLQLPLPP